MHSRPVISNLQRSFVWPCRSASIAFLVALASLPLQAQEVIFESHPLSPMTIQGSSIPAPPVVNREVPTQEHYRPQPGQPVDLSKLSADVLNCDECRRRLGLPPLVKPIVEKIVARIEPNVATPVTPSPSDTIKPSEALQKPLGDVKATLKLESPQKEVRTSQPSPSDLMLVEGVLTSPATQKIEIEILKKQLQERDNHLKKLSAMQSDVEQRIDQLVKMNEELAKKDAGRQIEMERLQKTSDQTIQARDLELSNLKAELSSVRAEAREQAKRLSDQLADTDNAKSIEIAKLSNELIESKKARVDAMTNLRAELASSQKNAMSETGKAITEQLKTIETQRANIRELETQLAKAEKVQQDDAARLDKLRKELAAANAERTKGISETAIQSNQDKKRDPSKNPSASDTAKADTKSKSKAKAAEPATDPAKSNATPAPVIASEKPAITPPTPVENEPKRRAF